MSHNVEITTPTSTDGSIMNLAFTQSLQGMLRIAQVVSVPFSSGIGTLLTKDMRRASVFATIIPFPHSSTVFAHSVGYRACSR